MTGLGLDPHLALGPNGLRLITVARPGTPTVAVRVYVRAGSRYDDEHLLPDSTRKALGMAHLAEHLIFQGTETRSQREIFDSVERLGGALDAGTTKEYATFSVVMPRHGLQHAIQVLAELITEPALRESDLWSEKLIVLEETRSSRDQQSVIHDLFAETMWEHHPFRHPVQGSPERVRDLDHRTLVRFFKQRYVAGNMVVSVCGDVAHEEVGQLASDAFGRLKAGPERPPRAVDETVVRQPKRAHLEKDIGHTHLLIGVPTVDMRHEDRGPLKVVERVLGMGGSSRLYQRLREELGLVYSVRTVTAHYEDTGCFAVHTSCDPKNVVRVEEAVFEVWEQLGVRGVSSDELGAAKGNYAGTLARRFETNKAVAGIFGVEGLLHRPEPFEEALQRINAVSCDDVVRVARTYLNRQRSVSASVGRA